MTETPQRMGNKTINKRSAIDPALVATLKSSLGKLETIEDIGNLLTNKIIKILSVKVSQR